ncbi:hypothetical protein PI124_g12580 [Phytophthora idaei]|nr:hypothetical protein PI125_g11935 [Phytophthora idaei]KAG3150751.1 hypothetical protein PI126_g11313 [Phytophthora idaei]KAG3242600.1 hypothetical protein PI124_g12580 [Phytophthora idaei]
MSAWVSRRPLPIDINSPKGQDEPTNGVVIPIFCDTMVVATPTAVGSAKPSGSPYNLEQLAYGEYIRCQVVTSSVDDIVVGKPTAIVLVTVSGVLRWPKAA